MSGALSTHETAPSEILHGRRARATALAAMALLYIVVAPYAVLHLDIARDLLIALRIARGDEYPLLGPLLAATIKLGPAWYYVLAPLVGATGSAYAAIVGIAVLGSLQFPLAYLAGKALHSRTCGLLWALLLLLPSWSTFEQVYPMHTQLTAALVLAFVVCAVRIARGGGPRYWYGLALAFSLALHAHPSTLGLAGIAAVLAGWCLWRRALRWRTLLGAAALALVPLAPFLAQQAATGFELLEAAARYLFESRRTGTLADAPTLAWQTLSGGLDYWLRWIGGFDPALVAAAVALAVGLQGLGLAAWLARATDPATRRAFAAEAAALIGVLLAITLIRAEHPYYMTTTFRVLLSGAVALGLARLGVGTARRWMAAAAVVVVCTLNVAVTTVLAQAQTRGSMPVAFYPLLDLARDVSPHTPMLLVSAYALPRSGAFACSAGPLALHGALGERLVHGYAIDARLACPAPDVVAGGSDPGREHWLGISRALSDAAGLAPQRSLGPVHLFRVRRVLGDSPAFVPPYEPRYPPMPASLGASVRTRIEATLAPGEHLAVSNIGFSMVADPAIGVRIDGREAIPLARDMVATIYGCVSCDAPAGVSVEIEIDAPVTDRVDAVIF